MSTKATKDFVKVCICDCHRWRGVYVFIVVISFIIFVAVVFSDATVVKSITRKPTVTDDVSVGEKKEKEGQNNLEKSFFPSLEPSKKTGLHTGSINISTIEYSNLSVGACFTTQSKLS